MRVPGAKPSPRVENGCLCWYRGDTFSLDLNLELRDAEGRPVALNPEDSLELTIRNCRCDRVEQVTWQGTELAGGSVTFRMDEARSRSFVPGDYTYDICLHHGERVTLAKNNLIRVEDNANVY